MAVPFRIPDQAGLDALRGPVLKALDALRDEKVRAAAAALNAGYAIEFTRDGHVLSRRYPDGRVETFEP